jgi:hypothetical protein
MAEGYTLWARVGYTLEVPKEDVEEFGADPKAYFEKALKSGKAFMDGETYFPEEDEENLRAAVEVGKEDEELGWNA